MKINDMVLFTVGGFVRVGVVDKIVRTEDAKGEREEVVIIAGTSERGEDTFTRLSSDVSDVRYSTDTIKFMQESPDWQTAKAMKKAREDAGLVLPLPRPPSPSPSSVPQEF